MGKKAGGKVFLKSLTECPEPNSPQCCDVMVTGDFGFVICHSALSHKELFAEDSFGIDDLNHKYDLLMTLKQNLAVNELNWQILFQLK